jgi:hypothetical protein
VARAVEDHDDQVVDAALESPRDRLEVVLDRRFEVDGALGGGSDDDLLHVAIGRVEQAAGLGGGEHGDGAGASGGAEVRALERVDRDVYRLDGVMVLGADLFADEEHRRLVALALADDDRAVDRDRVEAAAHRFDGGAIAALAIAHSHGAG